MAADISPDKRYIREQIQSATPEELLILMYDGAIRSLEESKKHASGRDLFRFNELMVKAQRIIAELLASLKNELNPEVVPGLARLYEFMYQHLVQANLKRDTRKIEEVLGLLTGLRDTWRQAIDKAAMEKAEGGTVLSVAGPKTGRIPSFSIQA